MRAVAAAAVDNGVGGGRRWSRWGEEGMGGEDAEVRSVLSASLRSISSKQANICKLSRRLPADFQELHPLYCQLYRTRSRNKPRIKNAIGSTIKTS